MPTLQPLNANAGVTTSALNSTTFLLDSGDFNFSIPDCFASTHSALSELYFSAANIPADGGAQLISQLPGALTSFSMSYSRPETVRIPFPWDALMEKASNLRSLALSGILTYFAASPIDEVITKLATIPTLTTLILSPGNLNGTLPANLFSLMPQLTSLQLQSNSITGTIPGGLWPNLLGMILSGNKFVALPVDVTAPKLLMLNLQQNALTTVPDFVSGFPALQTLNLDHNDQMQLEQLPPGLFEATSQLRVFSATNCKLNGSIPAVTAPNLQGLILTSNNLCGTLPRLLASTPLQYFLANSNFLTGSIHPEYLNRSLNMLDISDNMLSGTLPPIRFTVFPTPSNFVWMLNGNRDLSGPLPTLDVHPAATYSAIRLEYTSLSWCERQEEVPVVFPLSRMATCFFNLTLACNCPALLNAICTNIDTQCQNPTATILPPTPRESTCPAIAPVAIPAVAEPFGCAGTRPSPQFSCINGSWTFQGDLSTNSTLVLPPNSIIKITGNLTSNSSIVFNGLGSTIVVDGCVFIGKNGSGHVEIELTQDDLETIRRNGGKLTQTLISSKIGNACNGSTDLSSVNVSVKKPSGTCRKVKVDKTQSTQSSLVATFALDNSVCNVIIVVPSVVGAVIVLTAIAVVVILVVKKKNSEKYSDRLNKN